MRGCVPDDASAHSVCVCVCARARVCVMLDGRAMLTQTRIYPTRARLHTPPLAPAALLLDVLDNSEFRTRKLLVACNKASPRCTHSPLP